MEKIEDKKAEQMISHMMLDMGVPAHLKGYRYVRSAVLMAEEDMKVVGSVTKLLYPEIAKQYNTTDGKVERAIRNAIEISWERGNKETFEGLFGYCSESGQGRPTNSEYIAVIADEVRIQINTGCGEN
ncbi:MAG: sporulation initiation factor Spo0A C-terminal domain-containing protein [Lachnospiraceae bacterium]|nr:sporulation initiation factor Spo0A C-terminal domain-containing protein [Lachnospiraceae bacterium]